VFFTLLNLSTGAITNFSVVALAALYATPLPLANAALSGFLAATAVGVLAGGFIADLTRRHAEVAAASFGVTALVTLVIGSVPLGAVLLLAAMITAGFLSGMIAPSRDMMVRAAAPPGAAGRVFGIVTTGFNIGGAVGPMLCGWIMDNGIPRWIFYSSAVFMLLTVVLALHTDWRSRRRARADTYADGLAR
jgi:MFS family permease